METKKAFLISNIEEYGKLLAYCIEKDIVVWRSYWDEREKGDRCYVPDFRQKRLFYSSKRYWELEGYQIITPKFEVDNFGNYRIV